MELPNYAKVKRIGEIYGFQRGFSKAIVIHPPYSESKYKTYKQVIPFVDIPLYINFLLDYYKNKDRIDVGSTKNRRGKSGSIYELKYLDLVLEKSCYICGEKVDRESKYLISKGFHSNQTSKMRVHIKCLPDVISTIDNILDEKINEIAVQTYQ